MANEARETLSQQSRPRQRGWRDSQLWRAIAYLGPYRRIVIASIILAWVAGGVLVSVVPATFGILQTLLHGDTPGAVTLARTIRREIEAGGGCVVPISRQLEIERGLDHA